MIKKLINFLDKHRFLLILLILMFITVIFLSIKSYQFLHHSYKSLTCTEEIDERYCYSQNIKIFKDAESERKAFFKEKEEQIKTLKEKYELPKWNKYTSYYYEVVSLLEYNNSTCEEEIYNFFHIYNNTYEISEFYKDNIFYYDIFYHFKINLNN